MALRHIERMSPQQMKEELMQLEEMGVIEVTPSLQVLVWQKKPERSVRELANILLLWKEKGDTYSQLFNEVKHDDKCRSLMQDLFKEMFRDYLQSKKQMTKPK